jgi:FMN phosphatase YigB (HAD superfamily)
VSCGTRPSRARDDTSSTNPLNTRASATRSRCSRKTSMTPDHHADSVPTPRALSAAGALVCDLDNTLFDAVRAWAESFDAMLRVIVESGLIDRQMLLQAFKRLHVEHQVTELRHALSLLVELQPRNREWLAALLRGGCAYRLTYAETVDLYPGVRRTLTEIRQRHGMRIIGYTESTATIAEARVRFLGLDELIDILYVSKDLDVDPARLKPGFSLWPLVTLRCRSASVRSLPHDLLKPNPEALRAILTECEITPEQALYVGDHLHKDIPMATQAGVASVWARYGTERSAADAALLAEVCHWPATASRGDLPVEGIQPTHTIDNFSDLGEIIGAWLKSSPSTPRAATRSPRSSTSRKATIASARP